MGKHPPEISRYLILARAFSARSAAADLVRESLGHPLALAVLPQADQELPARTAETPLQSDRWFALTGVSFVQTGREGISLHDVARAHLLADLIGREPERFRRLQQQALGILRDRLASAGRWLAPCLQRRRTALQGGFIGGAPWPWEIA